MDSAQEPEGQVPAYAEDDQYHLPKSDGATERSRLEEQHYALQERLYNRIVHAPLRTPTAILDVGCGTGIVTSEIATKYPNATIYGVDLSPASGPTPPNTKMITGNIRDLAGQESLAHGSMNLVFSRFLVCGMTDWQGHVSTAASLAKPGGWVEIHDLSWRYYKEDGVPDDEHMPEVHALREVTAERNMDLDCGSNAAEYMRNVSLVDVEVFPYKCPMGTWLSSTEPESERLGRYAVGPTAVGAAHYLVGKMLAGHPKFGDKVKELQGNLLDTVVETPGKYTLYYSTIGRRTSQR